MTTWQSTCGANIQDLLSKNASLGVERVQMHLKVVDEVYALLLGQALHILVPSEPTMGNLGCPLNTNKVSPDLGGLFGQIRNLDFDGIITLNLYPFLR